MMRRSETGNGIKVILPQDEPPGLYVHVPFCKTKCPYCDFYSVTDLPLMEEWLRSLHKEMNLYRNNFDTFDSLYIGGGTPTVLNDPAMISLFEELHDHFSFAQDNEITVEVNPDDITLTKLELLKSLGVNRLSVGVQSFNDGELKLLQRRHTLQGAEKALRLINSAGFTNFGIDLMYGLPRQTEEGWTTTLKQALTFHPVHLSCYELTIEKSTPFCRMTEEGTLKTSSEEHGVNLFLLTSQFLEDNGFVHYEISNYSKGNEFRSRHNCKYWRHIPYLGLGPGAHSFQNGVRWWNCRSVKDYCATLEKGLRPIQGSETLSEEQIRLEKLFLGLRTREGITLEDAFPNSPPVGLLNNITKSRLVSVHDNRIAPTKKGFLMADRLPLLFP